jgi:hypothetical protein
VNVRLTGEQLNMAEPALTIGKTAGAKPLNTIMGFWEVSAGSVGLSFATNVPVVANDDRLILTEG